MSQRIDGVTLVADGTSRFVGDLQKSTNAYQDFISGFAKGAGEAGGLNSSLAALGTGMSAVGGAAGAIAVQIGQVLVGALIDAGKAMVDLAISAAPLEGLESQFTTITQGFETGAQGMLSALQSASSGMVATRDLMKTFNDAAALVNVQFAERLPEGLELLGKVSAATGEDMGFLLDSLVKGVGRVSPAILDNLKIQVARRVTKRLDARRAEACRRRGDGAKAPHPQSVEGRSLDPSQGRRHRHRDPSD